MFCCFDDGDHNDDDDHCDGYTNDNPHLMEEVKRGEYVQGDVTHFHVLPPEIRELGDRVIHNDCGKGRVTYHIFCGNKDAADEQRAE